jgi:hypothetical protein
MLPCFAPAKGVSDVSLKSTSRDDSGQQPVAEHVTPVFVQRPKTQALSRAGNIRTSERAVSRLRQNSHLPEYLHTGRIKESPSNWTGSGN